MTTEQDLQQAWAQAPKESSGYVQEWPPDGTYQALVRAFDDFEGKDGTEYVKTIFDITGPSHEGMPVEIINAKNVPERLGFLKEHFYLLGADVDSLGLDDIGPGSQARAELLDVPVELTVKTSKKTDASGQPYRNAYLDKRLGGKVQSDAPADTEGMEPAGVANAPGDERIPF
jgi:hypothetical protein